MALLIWNVFLLEQPSSYLFMLRLLHTEPVPLLAQRGSVFWYCHGDCCHHSGRVGAEKYESVAVASACLPTCPEARLVQSVGIGGLQMRLCRQSGLSRNAFLATLIEQSINAQCETISLMKREVWVSMLLYNVMTSRMTSCIKLIEYFSVCLVIYVSFSFQLPFRTLGEGMTVKSCVAKCAWRPI